MDGRIFEESIEEGRNWGPIIPLGSLALIRWPGNGFSVRWQVENARFLVGASRRKSALLSGNGLKGLIR